MLVLGKQCQHCNPLCQVNNWVSLTHFYASLMLAQICFGSEVALSVHFQSPKF